MATEVIESLRALGIEHAGSPVGVLTVSVGVGLTRPDQTQRLEDLVAQADRALYVAKSRGRDQWATGMEPVEQAI